MKKVTIIRDGRKETWNFVENLSDLEKFHKNLGDSAKTAMTKPYQIIQLSKGKKLLVNDGGGYNFLLPTDKVIEIK